MLAVSDTRIGEKLAALRNQRGLTQKQLEQASGVDRITISRIERGVQAAEVTTLRKLAAALDAHESELVDARSQSLPDEAALRRIATITNVPLAELSAVFHSSTLEGGDVDDKKLAKVLDDEGITESAARWHMARSAELLGLDEERFRAMCRAARPGAKGLTARKR